MFVATPTLRQRDDVIEFHFIVLQMFIAMLARVVVAPDDTHLCLESNIAASSTVFCSFGPAFSRVNDRTNMNEHRTLHFGDCSRNAFRVVFGIEIPDALLEGLPLFCGD